MLEQRVVSPLSTQKTRIVFSPLHGTAIKNLPSLLKLAGYDYCSTVLQQSTPDGNFPTVSSPNPEDPEAFQMAIEQGDRENANLIMATDPDADRIGICVKNNHGQWQFLNGNQLMTVLVRFVLENKKLNPQMFVASTIVSTPLIEKISAAKKIECLLTLTGFKWFGKIERGAFPVGSGVFPGQIIVNICHSSTVEELRWMETQLRHHRLNFLLSFFALFCHRFQGFVVKPKC